MRSAVGRTEIARKLPGAELAELVAAAKELICAEEHVGEALQRARDAGASWAQLGDALGITRQAAEQRHGSWGPGALNSPRLTKPILPGIISAAGQVGSEVVP
jgi:hypothetical protein